MRFASPYTSSEKLAVCRFAADKAIQPLSSRQTPSGAINVQGVFGFTQSRRPLEPSSFGCEVTGLRAPREARAQLQSRHRAPPSRVSKLGSTPAIARERAGVQHVARAHSRALRSPVRCAESPRSRRDPSAEFSQP